jgi:hypothetical protein
MDGRLGKGKDKGKGKVQAVLYRPIQAVRVLVSWGSHISERTHKVGKVYSSKHRRLSNPKK